MVELFMMIINIFTALIIIGCGYAIKAYPDLIAGYNTMSEARKKKVDIVGLSTFMKKSCIRIGVTMIVLSILMALFGFEIMISFGVVFSVSIVGTIIMVIKAQRYDGNRPAKPSVKPPTEEDYQEMIEKLNEQKIENNT